MFFIFLINSLALLALRRSLFSISSSSKVIGNGALYLYIVKNRLILRPIQYYSLSASYVVDNYFFQLNYSQFIKFYRYVYISQFNYSSSSFIYKQYIELSLYYIPRRQQSSLQKILVQLVPLLLVITLSNLQYFTQYSINFSTYSLAFILGIASSLTYLLSLSLITQRYRLP